MRVVLSMIFSFMMFFTLNCKELSYNKIQPHPRLLMKRGEEKKIIKHLYCGKKRREIAEIEFISLETVKTHVSHILKKLSFQSTSELIKFLTKIKIFDEFDL